MEELKNALQRSTSQMRNVSKWKGAQQLSPRQRDERERFRKLYPNIDNVLAYFAPVKWASALRETRHSLLFPTITLMMVDDIYQFEGLAKQVVRNNLTGIFMLAEPREERNEQAIEMTADLFVSRFGGELSIFAMLYYFAAYLTEYKQTYGKFDLQDVLRQMGKSFLPWWRLRLGRDEDKKADDDSQKGDAAMMTYLQREYIAKGRDIRESNIYDFVKHRK